MPDDIPTPAFPPEGAPQTITADKIDVSMLLQPEELNALVAAGLNPAEHTAIDMGVAGIQQGRAPTGDLVLQLIVPVPRDLFTKRSRLVLPNGAQQNELDEVMALPPKVRLIVRKDRVDERTIQQMQQFIAAQLASVPSG
jgi:hypothetical protein